MLELLLWKATCMSMLLGMAMYCYSNMLTMVGQTAFMIQVILKYQCLFNKSCSRGGRFIDWILHKYWAYWQFCVRALCLRCPYLGVCRDTWQCYFIHAYVSSCSDWVVFCGQVQVQMLQSQQAQRCLQVLPEAQEQSPPLGRRREKPLLLETSLPGHHQGVATISLGAAHAQLRRLRNCSSSLLKEATVTCVAPHHSKVGFLEGFPNISPCTGVLDMYSTVLDTSFYRCSS